MYVSTANNVGKNNGIKEKVCYSLATENKHYIEKAMSQPFKLFLDLLKDFLFHVFELFSSYEKYE